MIGGWGSRFQGCSTTVSSDVCCVQGGKVEANLLLFVTRTGERDPDQRS